MRRYYRYDLYGTDLHIFVILDSTDPRIQTLIDRGYKISTHESLMQAKRDYKVVVYADDITLMSTFYNTLDYFFSRGC